MSSYSYSDISGGPGNWMLLFWVIVSWIRELTVVVFLIQSFLSGLADLEEVGKVLSVGEVLVEVILEVLDEVHVLLDEIVSSDSWERESGIIKLPGVDENSWVFAHLGELTIDLHGVIVVLSVTSSAQVVEFNVQVLLRDLKSLFTWLSGFKLDSLGEANNGKSGVEFHFSSN